MNGPSPMDEPTGADERAGADEPTGADEPAGARTFWDARYGERPRIWSGSVNQALADVITGLAPGRALDLGCGEGGDSVWLAEAGWQVTGVDVSATALDRARELARSRGIDGEQISWKQIDLVQGFPVGEFDLVSACFLASPLNLPRAAILRQAAKAVTRGGTLLTVSHAAPPPWARHAHDHQHSHDSKNSHDFPSPVQELETLDLDYYGWEIITAEVRSRQATGPDGEQGVLNDTVVVARRH